MHVGYWMFSVLSDATMGEQSFLAAGLKLLACSPKVFKALVAFTFGFNLW